MGAYVEIQPRDRVIQMVGRPVVKWGVGPAPEAMGSYMGPMSTGGFSKYAGPGYSDALGLKAGAQGMSGAGYGGLGCNCGGGSIGLGCGDKPCAACAAKAAKNGKKNGMKLSDFVNLDKIANTFVGTNPGGGTSPFKNGSANGHNNNGDYASGSYVGYYNGQGNQAPSAAGGSYPSASDLMGGANVAGSNALGHYARGRRHRHLAGMSGDPYAPASSGWASMLASGSLSPVPDSYMGWGACAGGGCAFDPADPGTILLTKVTSFGGSPPAGYRVGPKTSAVSWSGTDSPPWPGIGPDPSKVKAAAAEAEARAKVDAAAAAAAAAGAGSGSIGAPPGTPPAVITPPATPTSTYAPPPASTGGSSSMVTSMPPTEYTYTSTPYSPPSYSSPPAAPAPPPAQSAAAPIYTAQPYGLPVDTVGGAASSAPYDMVGGGSTGTPQPNLSMAPPAPPAGVTQQTWFWPAVIAAAGGAAYLYMKSKKKATA